MCSAKKSGVQRRLVISQVVAFAPSSQNSKRCGLRGLGPGAAHAGEPVGLVLMQEDAAAAERHMLAAETAAE